MSMRNRRKVRHDRIARRSTPALQPVGEGPPHYEGKAPKRDAVVDCGWGRLIFAHTFADPKKVADVLRQEASDKRDVAFYLRDPHVVLAMAPPELFLDPSHPLDRKGVVEGKGLAVRVELGGPRNIK